MPGLTLPVIPLENIEKIKQIGGMETSLIVTEDRNEILEAAANTEIIFGRIDPEIFAAALNLRWIHSSSSGIDMLLFPEFVESNIILTCEKGLVGTHLADHAFALLLALTRQLGVSLRLGNKAWNERVAMRKKAIELTGLTMGIVGMGGTGKEVAKRAVAFGMNVKAVDRNPTTSSLEADSIQSMQYLPELLSESDVVTICAPLTNETRRLFDEKMILKMKPGSFLINITRGPIIDDKALVHALDRGHLAGAGLDVVLGEPLGPEHPLWNAPNVVMTPHTAGASPYRTQRNMERFQENLHRYKTNQPLIGVVDKKLGF